MTTTQRSRRQRVVILTTELAAAGGIQAVSRDVVRAVSGADVNAEVWSLLDSRAAARAVAAGAGARGASGSRLRYGLWSLLTSFAATPPDLAVVLHAHLAPVALPLAYRGARLVVFLHGTEVWRRLTVMERAAFMRSELLIATSRFAQARFQSFNPDIDVRIELCPLSVPLLSPLERPPAVIPRRALLVGRMAKDERYKGHDLLLDIWPRVAHRVPGATLLIAGDGDDRARLMQRARDEGLASAVHFAGHVSDAELRVMYEECQVFVLPSRLEGFGIVFLEAMRAAKACIGATGAAEDVIDAGRTGYLVDLDQPRTLEDALVALLGDSRRAEEMGRAGRGRMQREFAAEGFDRRFRALIKLESAEHGIRGGAMAVPLV